MLEYITTEQLDALRANAIETLQAVNKDNPSKEMFLLIGACMGVLDYGSKTMGTDDLYSQSELLNDIKNTLHWAEKRLETFRMTQDRDYIQMAYDLNSHIQKLNGIAQEHGYDVANYEAWSMDLGERIARL